MDEVRLTLPPERQWQNVAHLVLSGLAARLDMTLEVLEDWQIALAELFARQRGERGVEVVFQTSKDCLTLRFGPASTQLLAELEQGGDGVGLRRVLSTLFDSVESDLSGDDYWVVLTRAVEHPSEASDAN